MALHWIKIEGSRNLHSGDRETDKRTCRAHNGTFACTRKSGHSGPHEATDGKKIVARWPKRKTTAIRIAKARYNLLKSQGKDAQAEQEAIQPAPPIIQPIKRKMCFEENKSP